jgi:hypothetical protein
MPTVVEAPRASFRGSILQEKKGPAGGPETDTEERWSSFAALLAVGERG